MALDIAFAAQSKAKKRKPIPFHRFIEHVKIEDTQKNEIVQFEPWPYLVELAEKWGKGESDTVLKARQLGITWLAVIYAYWVIRRPSSRVLVISQGQDYSKEFLARLRVVHENLPDNLRREVKTDNSEEFSLIGGGTCKALPSTENAGRSFTASVVIVDEAAFHPYAAQNYKAYRPTVADGGQLLVMSTAEGNVGWFAQRFRAQEKRGRASFIPWYARPGRDQAWYDNELLEWQTEASDAAEGRDFLQEYPATVEEAFSVRSGRVFEEFSKERHVVDRPPVAWEDCEWRVMGIDFGGTQPTAIIPMGVARVPYVKADAADRGWQLIVYDEFYSKTPVSIRDVALYCRAWHARAPLTAIAIGEAKNAPEVRELQRYFPNLDIEGMKGPPKVRNQYHQQMLAQGKLSILDHCLHIFREYESYLIKEITDPNTLEKYATATPVDHHADAMDAMGYAITYIMRAIRSGKAGQRILNYHRSFARQTSKAGWPWNVIRGRRRIG